MSDLSEKLKSLGVKVGVEQIITPLTKPKENLESILGGIEVETHSGQTFIIETRYPLDHLHGQNKLQITAQMSGVSTWLRNPEISSLPIDTYAFIDTETSGLSSGAGTIAFLIGIGRFENDYFSLKQLFLREPGEEPAQLELLEQLLAPCRTVVTFNGKSFDLPILTNRFIFYRWPTPFSDLHHIDLLPLARQLWRDRLPSRTLGALEHQILNLIRLQEDVPGWMIPHLYFDYLRSRDALPLRNVFYHNAMDVLSLVSLLNHTAKLIADPLNCKIDHGEDIVALARLYENLGEIDTAISIYFQALERNPPESVYLLALKRLACIYKKANNWEAAIQLWIKAANKNYLDAHIELAKYYEHKMRRFDEAIFWTESAMTLVKTPHLLSDPDTPIKEELEHRLNRLLRKKKTA